MNIVRIMLIAAVTLVASVLFGCADDAGFSLSRDSISLKVGESRSLLPYVVFSHGGGSSGIVLKADSDCVSVDGAAITAVKPGTAEIKISAHGKTSVMTVSVSYGAVQDFSVTAENNVQTARTSPQPVVLTAEFDGHVDPDTVVQWEVNGTGFTGSRFEYTPQGYGEYTATVTVGSIVKQCEIKVYRHTEVQVSHTDINNAQAYVPITFTAYEAVNSLNPRSVYEWSVNGEKKGSSPSFTFTPAVGEYRISLYVNGEEKPIDGNVEYLINVTSDGAEDYKVVYDDAEGVYVRWAAERKVMYVSIVSPDGKRRIFDVTDAQHTHLFSAVGFRATEYIDVCAQNPYTYEITIGTDSGKHELIFSQFDWEVQPYLDNKVLCKNSFISSEDDARAWVRELYAVGASTAECYAADGAQSIQSVITEQAESLGLDATTTVDGNRLSVSFLPYVNKPSKYDSPTANIQSNGIPPHIEFTEDNRRPTDYIFASDRLTRSVAVRGSEQLLIAVSCGFKPITQSGDAANSVYRAAKSILLRIIGSEYTPRKKVHAIYDWLQWISVNVESADADSASRYLEGVFTTSKSPTSGLTSEGAAKAFCLLCGIEGIPCEIYCDREYGYYNKVKLGEQWYNVDVYGGKITVRNGTSSVSVINSHIGLLISDGALERLGCTKVDAREAYDITETEYMQKRRSGVAYFDNYICKAEANYESVRTAVYYAFNNAVRDGIPIPFVGGKTTIYRNSFEAELACDVDMTKEEINAVTAHINKAIDEYASDMYNATFRIKRIFIVDNVISVSAESLLVAEE